MNVELWQYAIVAIALVVGGFAWLVQRWDRRGYLEPIREAYRMQVEQSKVFRAELEELRLYCRVLEHQNDMQADDAVSHGGRRITFVMASRDMGVAPAVFDESTQDLRRKVSAHFNMEELTELMRDMGWNPQEVPCDTPTECAALIIDRARRMNRTPMLMSRLRVARPEAF